MESESAPEVCTVTGPADAGAGAMALPLLPSLPVTAAEKAMVPTPPTFQVQMKFFDAPPDRTVPAVLAGELAPLAEAPPAPPPCATAPAPQTPPASPGSFPR